MTKETKIRYREGSPLQIQIFLTLIIFFAFIVILLLFFTFSSKQRHEQQAHSNTSTKHGQIFRLPRAVVPELYDLKLQIFLPYRQEFDFGDRNFTTSGDLLIKVACKVSTNRIFINAKYLTIKSSTVRIYDCHNVSYQLKSINRYHYDIDDQHVIEFLLQTYLKAGERYYLKIEYKGLINDVWAGGLFKTDYDIHNDTRLLTLTQLQPTDASRLLPCFDDPEMKAAFHLTIIHPSGTSSISNTPISRLRQINAIWSETDFEISPVMSTYLLAIAVSDFTFKFQHCRNIEIRVWTQPSKLSDIDYAIHITCRLLLYYEIFFSIPYPLKKLDLFAVPELRVLAMENWGLIVVRQKLLVYNPNLNSLRERRIVTDVLAHEVAHMWFGNLATMRWWNDLWLNEGFATMMGQKAADYVENTTIRMTQYFAADITLKALSSDQHTMNAQPISLKSNSDRLHGQDSKILYNKGAAVLRMVESTLSEDVFRHGLHFYLIEFSYSNADKNDFLNSFSKIFKASEFRNDSFVATSFSVSDFIDSWIYQRGFPLVKVHQVSEHFELTQEIFDVDGTEECASSQWKIPIFIDKNGRIAVTWLQENQKVIVRPETSLFYLDPLFHGYYRVQYDDHLWENLAWHLLHNHTVLTVSSRLKLLDDAFVLAENGRLSYDIPLRMSAYLREETEVVPFITFLARFETVLFRAHRHPNSILVNKYIQYLLEPSFERILAMTKQPGDENYIDYELLRELVYLKMCGGGYPKCLRLSRKKFSQLYKNCSKSVLSSHCNRIDPSLRNVVYMAASKYGNQSDLLFLIEKHRTEVYHMERDRIFSSLAATSNRTHIALMAKQILYHKDRDTDFRPKLYELARKNYDNGIVEKFLAENFNDLQRMHRKYASFFALQMTKGYGTEEDMHKLNEFEKSHTDVIAKLKPVFMHIRKDIQRKIDWNAKYADHIFDYLAYQLKSWHGMAA